MARARHPTVDGGRPSVAVILAGGLGTRLRPAVSDRPKPLADVAGRPFLEYLLEQVRRSGIMDVMLCTGHQAELVEAAFGRGDPIGLRLSYSVEEEPLGTAGALRRLAPRLAGRTLLVMNGDSYFDLALEELFAFHAASGATVSIALRQVESTERYGAVRIDADGRITQFEEKGPGAGPGLINGGIYVFGPDVLELIPDRVPLSLERDVFPALIPLGVYGRRFEGFFVDIGLPADYERLRADPRFLAPARS